MKYRIRQHTVTRKYIAEVKGWFFWICLDFYGRPLKWIIDTDYRLEEARGRIIAHQKAKQNAVKPGWEIVYQETERSK